MEQATLILIVITLLLLVIILGFLSFLIFKLLNKPQHSNFSREQSLEDSTLAKPDIARSEFHPAILERIKESEKLKNRRADLFCPNHLDEPGEVMCAICDKLYCKACIKPFKNLHFCREHLPLIMKHEWEEVFTLKTSTEDPEEGVRLYDQKKDIFEKESIPTYIETHYKINVDQDYIETYLVMFGIKEEIAKIKSKLGVN